ncbi:hypothetical protein SteCoe_16942 [Stentor coeruleus]|uniref:Uncharacterized protein n=1 Tax=Stentor coeruleus TaxID=5963 RepID=A0A1R2C094_9CILI|nr:hypothetical protein SteCoe_16942 [Stentor coeruleus]
MMDYLFFFIGFFVVIRCMFYISTVLISLTSKASLSTYENTWAIITGATDGIGLGFACELAKHKINLILISRSNEKLDKVASDLKSIHGIQIKTIAKDLNSFHKNPISEFLAIYNLCKDLKITILINNVGLCVKKKFLYTSLDKILEQIVLNTFSIVFMTQLFIDDLQKSNNGVVINISSIAGLIPSPGACVYAAGKSFDEIFSRVLQEETQIKVLCLQPSFVETKMTKDFKYKPLSISKEECAKGCLKDIGKVMCSSGNYKHWVSYTLMIMTRDFIKMLSGFSDYV